MIVVENLTKEFKGTPAVKNISFSVKEGETLVLLGTSGCGKTTTLRMINRLINPTKGAIFINDKNVMEQQPEELRRGIGYVLQSHGLFPHYTIEKNIAIVPTLLKWDKKRIVRRTEELMHKLQLPNSTATAYPNELSGGQQQRVGLARALAADASILLMDEPFGALDPITRASIREEFKQLDELNKKTVVLVTHDVQEAFELGDTICLMHEGEIMQIGTAAELLFKPANEFVQEYFNHQRLQLELNSVLLKEIWHELPSGNNNEEPKLKSNNSLWEALAKASTVDTEINVIGEADDVKKIDFNTIQSALNKVKRKA